MDALAGSPISINVKVLLVDTNESNCCRNVQLLGWSTGPGKTFAVRWFEYYFVWSNDKFGDTGIVVFVNKFRANQTERFFSRSRSYPSNLLREEAAVLKRIRFAKLFDPCL
ncbi:hypothetical protein Plhal304r1_c013g0049151 [Plasmopara halstedii]